MKATKKKSFLNKADFSINNEISGDVSAAGTSSLLPFAPLPLFSCSHALRTTLDLPWMEQTGIQHYVIPAQQGALLP